MTKLSDTQGIILSAAAQRSDGNLLPLPGSLRGGAATKVVGALLARGLIREQITDSPRRADAALNTVWRNEDDGRGVLLSSPGRACAIGVEPDADSPASRGDPGAVEAPKKRGRPKMAAVRPSRPSRPRGGRPATTPSRRR